MNRVKAKPVINELEVTLELPITYMIMQAMKVVTLQSRMADQARLKPASMAARTTRLAIPFSIIWRVAIFIA